MLCFIELTRSSHRQPSFVASSLFLIAVVSLRMTMITLSSAQCLLRLLYLDANLTLPGNMFSFTVKFNGNSVIRFLLHKDSKSTFLFYLGQSALAKDPAETKLDLPGVATE